MGGMSMRFDLTLGFLTPYSLALRQEGERLFEIVSQTAPQLYPEFVSNFEPITRPVNPQMDMLELWHGSFLWKRKRPVVEGQVLMGNQRAHDAITIWLTLSGQDIDALPQLLKHCGEALRCDFAYIHYWAEHEDSIVPYSARYPLENGITTFDLRNNIPNLPWGTYFGPPYVRLFGLEKLLTSPLAQAVQVGPDAVYLQRTDRLSEWDKDPREFERLR